MGEPAAEWYDFIPPSAADKIATEIANLPWARGNSVEEACWHHGEIQEIIAKHSPTLPSREEIEAEILPMTYAGADLTECVERILALFTAPQPLAKTMPLDTGEGVRRKAQDGTNGGH